MTNINMTEDMIDQLKPLTYEQYKALIPGTKLICINNTNYDFYLTKNKIYLLDSSCTSACVNVTDEDGKLVDGGHVYTRFALAPNNTKYLIKGGIFFTSDTIEPVEVISKTPTITYHNEDGDETEYKTLVKLPTGEKYTLGYNDKLFNAEVDAIVHIIDSVKEKYQRDLEYLPRLLANIDKQKKHIQELETLLLNA